MGINLTKGQKIELKDSKFKIGLGWSPNQGTGQSFDLDCSVFLLNGNKVIPTENHFVFYNNPKDPNEAIKHSGDDTSGKNSAGGDDETISIDTAKLGKDIIEMIFVVSIHEAKSRNQNFGMIRESYIRIVDENETEVAKYELDENFSIETSIEFGRLYKKDNQWKFDASGIGYKEDLAYFINKYHNGIVAQ